MADKSRKRNKPRSRVGTIILFWICVALIAAPFAVLGYILYTSSQESHKPVIGNRYDGDLDPAIEQSQMTEIEESVKGLEGVESANVTMTTATLRVYADVKDDADEDYTKTKAKEVYDIVAGVLNPDIYFTQSDGKKMYDLEVHVYNLAENRDSDAFVYVIREKTSAMGKPKSQVVSKPKNAELAQRLRDEAEARMNATPTPETEEGGEIEVNNEDIPEGEQTEEQEGQ